MSSGPPPPLRDLRARWFAAAVLACAAVPVAGQDRQPPASAALLHAMMMLKIAPYLTVATPPKPPEQGQTDKPAKAASYRIAVVGEDDVATAATTHLRGKCVGSAAATTSTVSLRSAVSGTSAGDYDMLYIAASVDAASVAKIVASHADKPVVLVSLQNGFCAAGGTVQLFVRDNRLCFELQVEALKKHGLRANSHVLKLSSEAPR